MAQGATLVDGFGGPAGFGVDSLARANDRSQPLSAQAGHPQFSAALAAAFPNGFNFYGVVYRTLHINDNGSISFAGSSPALSTAPFPRPAGGVPQIAPFLADVDTRGVRPGVDNRIYFAVDAANRRLVITWNQVGYFNRRNNLLNTFQVILTARNDLAPGDFDIDYLYNRCEWSAGEGQTADVNGVPLPARNVIHARVGFDAANGVDFAELAPLSGTARVLELCSLSNAGTPGGWSFPARGGDVFVCGNGVVEPGEECDEADTNLRFRSGDGCSSDCRREVDLDCDYAYSLVNRPADGIIPPGYDNCPGAVQINCGVIDNLQESPRNPTYNPQQLDNDGDGLGDACDDDDDNDTLLDIFDNCPQTPNGPNDPGADEFDNDQDGRVDEAGEESQFNYDGDDKGDLCDIDSDNDGVTDYAIEGDPTTGDVDNCRFTFNPAQTDTDGDGIGDPCDPDADNDGVLDCGDDGICDPDDDGYDNDRDGRIDEPNECPGGQPCDTRLNLYDDDGDGYVDNATEDGLRDTPYPGPDPDGSEDNCRLTRNGVAETNVPGVGNQLDNDEDGRGDACDPDDDNDGILDGPDNCPFVFNPGQHDNDADGIGDPCDPDDDNDGILDCGADGRCPPSGDGIDNDGDGRPDEPGECDDATCRPATDGIDNDGDGQIDEPGENFPPLGGDNDNCQFVPNPDQRDIDRNGQGDVCDQDGDGDSVPNERDNCVEVFNPDQGDEDDDGIGNLCDCDRDGDGANNQGVGQTGEACEGPLDNCPFDENVDQRDTDGDGIGDVCDDDNDRDTIADDIDNCPLVFNPDQLDDDADQIGNLCDCDQDGDGWINAGWDFDGALCVGSFDNCPLVVNADQTDADEDGIGDVCDCDADGDGANETGWNLRGEACQEAHDNCIGTANDDQVDTDEDDLGDACDCDLDGDGFANRGRDIDGTVCIVPAEVDNCPGTRNRDQIDTDGDGIGDVCDDDPCTLISLGRYSINPCSDDWDSDGIVNARDNCRLVANPDQRNTDQYGGGDVCEDDDDQDGVPDDEDNCPLDHNWHQVDLDGDGAGDPCDADDDQDGVADLVDNCPRVSNPDQRDADRDGLGDVCDPSPHPPRRRGCMAGIGEPHRLMDWALVCLVVLMGARRRREQYRSR